MQVIRLELEQMDEAAAVLRGSYDAALPWLAGRHTPDEDRWFFRQVLFPGCAAWGGFVEGRLGGVMAVRPGWIEQLYVAPGLQRRGVGTALLQTALALGPPIELWTFQRNAAARRFY